MFQQYPLLGPSNCPKKPCSIVLHNFELAHGLSRGYNQWANPKIYKMQYTLPPPKCRAQLSHRNSPQISNWPNLRDNPGLAHRLARRLAQTASMFPVCIPMFKFKVTHFESYVKKSYGFLQSQPDQSDVTVVDKESISSFKCILLTEVKHNIFTD